MYFRITDFKTPMNLIPKMIPGFHAALTKVAEAGSDKYTPSRTYEPIKGTFPLSPWLKVGYVTFGPPIRINLLDYLISIHKSLSRCRSEP